ncbi:reverse transcriptase domain-containing protein [Tanacetum coccineum]
MSFMSGTSFGFHPFQFSYPPRKLTMEEMLYKFIVKGRQEHEEMGAFIREFKTTNELLLKERNNSLSELEVEVYGLSKAINNAQLSNYEVKGVTTRGGKTTNEIIRDTNDINKEPPILHHDKPAEPNEVKERKEEAQQQKFLENLKRLHINIPSTEALSQMPKYAKFLKGLLSNKTRLEEACTLTMNERCSAVLLNKLPSKEKDPGSFTIPCDIGHLHINNALADLGTSISLMPYTMYEKLGLAEPKPTRMSLELANRPPTEDDECYGIDLLDTTIHSKTHELLEDDQLDSFLVNNLEESIDLSDSKSYGKADDIVESRTPMQRFFQIPIAPEDQEKTTFTCPYGTFAYRRMPFGLCNATATFQRCMTAIFHDMVEDFMEFFMEDLSDAKPRLIRWVLLLQGFNIKIKDKKGAENLDADHLSRLENPDMGELAEDEIADKFPDEHLMILKAKLNDKEPWGNKYILVAVDYVSKWVKSQALLANDACVVVKFLKGLFARFRVPKALISDRGTHFCNSQLEKSLLKYRAFRTAYKTPTRCTPFRMVYGKACHLLAEIEHKAYWALKQCNIDFTAAAKNRFIELNKLVELRDIAYENTRIYKERTKRWHDSRLREDKKFINGDKDLAIRKIEDMVYSKKEVC